jgi:monofunctional biosynthetic peptidoglycan transglycosylase
VSPLERGTVRGAAGCIALVGVLVAGYLAWLPPVSRLKRENPRDTRYIRIYVRRLRSRGEKAAVAMTWRPLAEISPYLRRAVLIEEDDRFYRHRGVDWDELQKAADYDLKHRQFARGASTITQQLARNLYLSPSRSPWRKLQEALIARYMERVLDKDRILELYLNVAEWGEGVFGAEAASRAYFGKGADALTPEEAISLAVALPSPYRLGPDKPSAEATAKKRAAILERMRKAGALPDAPAPQDPS